VSQSGPIASGIWAAGGARGQSLGYIGAGPRQGQEPKGEVVRWQSFRNIFFLERMLYLAGLPTRGGKSILALLLGFGIGPLLVTLDTLIGLGDVLRATTNVLG
jgi:hypothetical protein